MKTIPTILLLMAMTCVGCGDNGGGNTAAENEAAETNNITSTDDMKAALESIAKSGERGSATMGFSETLEGLKATDAKKAEALMGDLKKLEAASSPTSIKKIAKQMADKL